MNKPIDVFITRDTELFSFHHVEADVYEITKDGRLAYGMISRAQGEKYMQSLRILYQ
ncbi:MAG: hypothetical protein KGI08_01955 [Thaumarchaeota archaeon]|nr:hypothetical protein [Nitrososphaerota archaeon]